MEPVLPQAAGYAVVCGMALFFAVLLNLITWIQNKYFQHSTRNADEFTTASRGVKTGLIVAGIVSSWTWSLTLLQPSSNAYAYGISGAYWYMVGGIIQITVFSAIAAKVKANAGRTTTFPEMAYFRYGTGAHITFLYCGLACNAIVSACILLGGGAVVNAVTGVNEYASLILFPFGVAAYIYFGGLRATFISDATHTFLLLVFVLVFLFEVFRGHNAIGSAGKLVELLTAAAKENPVANNYHGSYLTFRSLSGGIFSFQCIVNGFGLVNCDQAYWSRAIAAKPEITSRAYFLGAFAWMTVPFAIGISLGLSSVALSQVPGYTVPSTADANAGLVAVYAAIFLMGKAGAVIMLLMVFLSVTSAMSGELIAASTLLSYDVYKHYINPRATAKQVLGVSKLSVFIWAAFSALLASVFHKIGISMSWLFFFLGVVTAGGVIPISLAFMWKDLNKFGAIAGPLGGGLLALIVWLVTAKTYMGEITVDTLIDQWVSFAGSATALFFGGIIAVVSSWIKPQNFNWNITRKRSVLSEVSTKWEQTDVPESVGSEEKKNEFAQTTIEESKSIEDSDDLVPPADYVPSPEEYGGVDIRKLQQVYKKYGIMFLVLSFIIAIVIPVPLSIAPYIWSKGFFTAVVVLVFLSWANSFYGVVILPIVESRHELANLFRDLFTGSKTTSSSLAGEARPGSLDGKEESSEAVFTTTV
ncbi:DEKNAAC102975 [Brettanomyces naardenensis]|uniref:DEKNAAC102975 n=1 Tax=Brettanomyces naardenensis TaxID=13370 RepID=A0A448YM58_BRENA|nr:DEKNAAC102975 [Brettanomyces naardenensis]